MTESRSESYKAAGVDVTAGYEAVRLMKPHVESTFTEGVIGSLGWLYLYCYFADGCMFSIFQIICFSHI